MLLNIITLITFWSTIDALVIKVSENSFQLNILEFVHLTKNNSRSFFSLSFAQSSENRVIPKDKSLYTIAEIFEKQ